MRKRYRDRLDAIEREQLNERRYGVNRDELDNLWLAFYALVDYLGLAVTKQPQSVFVLSKKPRTKKAGP